MLLYEEELDIDRAVSIPAGMKTIISYIGQFASPWESLLVI